MTCNTIADDLIAKAERREALFGIVGLGYVGLPLAVELANAGYRVLGFDVQQKVVDGLNAGQSHIQDVSDAQLQAVVKAGRFERHHRHVAASASPTRSRSACRRRSSKIQGSRHQLHRRGHRRHQAHAPPWQLSSSRARRIRARRGRSCCPRSRAPVSRSGKDFFLAFSPERVDPGNPKYGTRRTRPRSSAASPPTAAEVAMALYQPCHRHVVPVSTTEAAELVKLLENTFRRSTSGSSTRWRSSATSSASTSGK